MDEPVYIYAFCDSPADVTGLTGLEGKPIGFIEAAGIYAAVSEAPGKRLRPQRRLLAAHQNVLSAIANEASVLPAAFGLVADDPVQLETTLAENATSLRHELERVTGCVEMDIRLAWDVPNVFEHLVEIDDHLRSLRDDLVKLGESASHDLRVAVGRRVEGVLAHARHDAGQRVTDALGETCREIQTHDPSGEAELVRLSALIERERLTEIDASLESLATAFDDSHAFRIAGPFAPHSFVDLHLDLTGGAQAG